ncbi:hypothetical protein [Arenimonas aestuarii]
MKHFRRQRRPVTFAILAMVALLWSQLSLAGHPACTLASMAMQDAHAMAANTADTDAAPCHGSSSPAPDDSAVCDTHCGRSELSSDVARTLAVPALGPLPVIPVMHLRHLPRQPAAAQVPGPLRSWHRPTRHPASLLLI